MCRRELSPERLHLSAEIDDTLLSSYLYGGVSDIQREQGQLICGTNVLCSPERPTISSKVGNDANRPGVSCLTDICICDTPVYLKRFQIGIKFVESSDPAAFAAAIDDKTKAIYVESIGNPKYNVAPLPELAKVGLNIVDVTPTRG